MADSGWRIIPPNVSAAAPSGNYPAIDAARGEGGAARLLAAREKFGGNYGFLDETIGPIADEIQGVVGAAGDFIRSRGQVSYGDLYRDYKNIAKQEQAAYREAHPVARIVANVVGMSGAARAGGAALSGAEAIRQGVKTGLGYGAAVGAAEGEGLTGRLEGAAVGGAVGGVVGLTIPLLTAGVSRLSTALQRIKGLKGDGARQRAEQMIIEALNRDGISLDDLARMRANGKPVTIADLGKNTRDLIGAAGRTGGEGKQIIDDFFEARTLGQYGRLNADLAGGTGMRGQDFAGTASDIVERRAAAAGPGYRAAYTQQAPTLSENVQTILQTPDGRRAVGLATRFMQNRRAPITDDAGNYTVEMLDQIQRAMRDIGTRAAGQRGTEQAANVGNLRNQFLAEIPDDLRAVMADYRTQSELLDALRAGRTFMRGDAEELGASIANMSPQEANMFRLGVVRELRGRMGSKLDSGDISGMFQNPQIRERLRAIFPSGRLFQEFVENTRTERLMQETRNALLKGSPTASRMVTDSEFNAGALGEAALDMATGGGTGVSLVRAATGMATRGKDRFLQGVNEAVGREAATLATNPNLRQVAASLNRTQGNLPIPFETRPGVMATTRAGAVVTGSRLSPTPMAVQGWTILPPESNQ